MIFKTKQYSESLLHFPSHTPSLSPPALPSSTKHDYDKISQTDSSTSWSELRRLSLDLSLSLSTAAATQKRRTKRRQVFPCAAHCARRGGREGREANKEKIPTVGIGQAEVWELVPEVGIGQWSVPMAIRSVEWPRKSVEWPQVIKG
jgi:hypothetical protein